jgi:hypothetical protein
MDSENRPVLNCECESGLHPFFYKIVIFFFFLLVHSRISKLCFLADMFVPRSALEVGALCFLSMFSLHLCSSAGDPQFHLPLYALFDSEVSILYQNVSIALLHTSLGGGSSKEALF